MTTAVIDRLLARYSGVTCVGLMGGDGDLQAVEQMAAYIHTLGLHVAWYTGRTTLPDGWHLEHFDYIKIGPYIKALGGLKSPKTNQRLYRVEKGQLLNVTERFWRK